MKILKAFLVVAIIFPKFLFSQSIPQWFMSPPNTPNMLIAKGTAYSDVRENAVNEAVKIAKAKLAKKINETIFDLSGDRIDTRETEAILKEASVTKQAFLRDKRAIQAFVLVEISKNKLLDLHHQFGASPQKPQVVSVPKPKPDMTEPRRYFLMEDFSEVKEGYLPQGWFGGDKLMVKQGRRGKYLTDFENSGKHSISITGLNMPQDFEITYLFQFGKQAFNTHIRMLVGKVTATVDVLGWSQLNKIRDKRHVDFRNKTIQATIRKEGPIFKLFVNGEERIMARIPEFRPVSVIQLEFTNMSNFKLFEIKGKSL